MEIPTSVLSEHFQERLEDRRVLGALFLTFEFDPGFFEQAVLPVILDVPVSHAEVPKLLQLESALRDVPHGVAVFYDGRALKTSDYASPKLDVRRIPVRPSTGLFHPKNVLLLVERPAQDGEPAGQALLVASLSANLTRTGWWENVEVCHVEELAPGDSTCLKEPLQNLLTQVQKLANSEAVADILRPYREFLRGLEQRSTRSTKGFLHTQMYVGGESIADFLKRSLTGAAPRYLEVISPFFDKAASSEPLSDLIDRFDPEEVRVFLPRDASGVAQCDAAFYDGVKDKERVAWGTLPAKVTQSGQAENATPRNVHAKVYRFFRPQPKREVLFVGSANLTRPAHSAKGGNVETGILVEVDPDTRPDFWLQTDRRKPKAFAEPGDESDGTDLAADPVELRYSWRERRAEIYWGAGEAPPPISLQASGAAFADGVVCVAREWTPLGQVVADRLGELLRSVSIIDVVPAGRPPTAVLVQEDDMELKPELARRLPVADILKYWALLKPEQRQRFLESRPELLTASAAGELMVAPKEAPRGEDLFSRLAGVFHAFGALERRVTEAIEDGHKSHAVALLFGERFDSLGPVLDRVGGEQEDFGDAVDRYLVLLCAVQLCDEVRRQHPDFWAEYRDCARRLDGILTARDAIRQQIVARDPDTMGPFLDWFDRWFVRRATPVEVS